jgi:integrase
MRKRRQCMTALPPLAHTMVGLALVSGLQRGEWFALRWRDLNETTRCVIVREAVYEGTCDTPKTEALRRIPLSEAGWQLLAAWKAHAKRFTLVSTR